MAPTTRPTSPPTVHVHRSKTSKRPFLSLDPVRMSLTEGTNIPEPLRELTPPPESAVSPVQDAEGKKRASSLGSGPLSSHPVTPIGGNSTEDPFPKALNGSVAQSPANNGSAAVQSPPSNTQRHSMMPGIPSYQGPPPPPKDAPMPPPKERRPSFARRFFRLGSLSSLRSRNPSSASLLNPSYQGSTRPSTDQFGPRGIKRPASQGANAGLSGGLYSATFSGRATPDWAATSEQQGNTSADASQTIPRMMRKKSMDFLHSARRRSGMWSRGGDSVMTEDSQQDQRRDWDRMSSTTDGRRSAAGRYSSMGMRGGAIQPERHWEPPPKLPELTEINEELPAEEMFRDIGREKPSGS